MKKNSTLDPDGSWSIHSSFYKFHQDYLQFVKYFITNFDKAQDDDYWQSVVDSADILYKRYPTKHSKDLILSFLNELESRERQVRSFQQKTA